MTTRIGPSRLLLGGLVVAALLAGCSPSSENASTDTPESSDSIARYTVRGRITSIPAEGVPTSQFLVHHEPIPSFVSGGKVVGMNEMTMPFPLAEGLSLEGYFVDDVIELTFEVHHDPETGINQGYEAVSLTRLSPDTQLVFDAPIEAQHASPDEQP
ncbi:MAG: hypothetical protein ACF8GE_04185 [Phycisphaerales bacterium JB043]